MATNSRILWVDDEIEMLRAHRIFLEQRGFDVLTATNGYDALEIIDNEQVDIIFLDENMPGMSGLEALTKIKELRSDVPVVMVTKSEEEDIMEQAIGSKIADYLIKPVNPNQLLLCVKKNIDSRRLINETQQNQYRSQFQQIAMQTSLCRTFDDWAALYQKLVYWELELQNVKTMDDIQHMQKSEANLGFAKFIRQNYLSWIANPDDAPLMSNRIMSRRILPMLDDGQKIVLIVIDNCRLDQWEVLRQRLAPEFNISTELYCSVLPTATQFARNAIFSGLMPSQIKKMYPQFWVDSDDESSQNQFENQLLGTFFERYRRRDISYGYYKVNDAESGNRIVSIFNRYKQNNLNAFVYNFVDMLSHARTDIKMVKELSMDEAAYRSLTLSWFEHSPLYEMIKMLGERRTKIVITTDHGAVKVKHPIKIVGERQMTTNLRFKAGRNMSYNAKDVFEIRNPEDAQLPGNSLATSYVFATNYDYFIYPNNYNHFVSLYDETFQHGGISMEEMIIPLAILEAK